MVEKIQQPLNNDGSISPTPSSGSADALPSALKNEATRVSSIAATSISFEESSKASSTTTTLSTSPADSSVSTSPSGTVKDQSEIISTVAAKTLPPYEKVKLPPLPYEQSMAFGLDQIKKREQLNAKQENLTQAFDTQMKYIKNSKEEDIDYEAHSAYETLKELGGGTEKQLTELFTTSKETCPEVAYLCSRKSENLRNQFIKLDYSGKPEAINMQIKRCLSKDDSARKIELQNQLLNCDSDNIEIMLAQLDGCSDAKKTETLCEKLLKSPKDFEHRKFEEVWTAIQKLPETAPKKLELMIRLFNYARKAPGEGIDYNTKNQDLSKEIGEVLIKNLPIILNPYPNSSDEPPIIPKWVSGLSESQRLSFLGAISEGYLEKIDKKNKIDISSSSKMIL